MSYLKNNNKKNISKFKKIFLSTAVVCSLAAAGGITASADNSAAGVPAAASYALTVNNAQAAFAAVNAKNPVKVTPVVKLSAPKLLPIKSYDSSYTHPYNHQTSRITLHWKGVKNAKQYKVFIKGGKYKKFTAIAKVKGKAYTVKGLKRSAAYTFKIQAVNGKSVSKSSAAQVIRTARMNYDAAGWQAMCRIVYHEVGKINTPAWDKPIVYVSDCVANRYVQAKYKNDPLWTGYYKNYRNIQSIIYQSGGFMSSRQLTIDGAAYKNVPSRVKKAVLGAVYGTTTYKGIKNDYNIYYWCNRSYKTNSPKIAYQFKIPWGYFNVWRSYWG